MSQVTMHIAMVSTSDAGESHTMLLLPVNVSWRAMYTW